MGDFYCSICNVRRVERDGDVCPGCQDPYQQAVPAPQQPPTVQSSYSASQPQTDAYDEEPSVPIHRSNRRILGAAPQQTGGQQLSRPASQQTAIQQPAQLPVTNSVPVQPAAANAPAQNAAAASKNGPQADGIVRNIQESKDNTPVLGRWMRSFSYGVPFPLTDDMMEFQVFSGWNANGNNQNGYSADKVIVYGTINSGKPIQDNTVRVYGTRAKNNAIIASGIENTTDGTYAEFNPPPMPAMAVRVITFLVLGLLLFLIIGIVSGFGGGSSAGGSAGTTSGAGSGFVTNLVMTIIGGLGTLFCFSQVKQAFANREWGRVFEYLLFALLAIILTISFLKGIF